MGFDGIGSVCVPLDLFLLQVDLSLTVTRIFLDITWFNWLLCSIKFACDRMVVCVVLWFGLLIWATFEVSVICQTCWQRIVFFALYSILDVVIDSIATVVRCCCIVATSDGNNKLCHPSDFHGLSFGWEMLLDSTFTRLRSINALVDPPTGWLIARRLEPSVTPLS